MWVYRKPQETTSQRRLREMAGKPYYDPGYERVWVDETKMRPQSCVGCILIFLVIPFTLVVVVFATFIARIGVPPQTARGPDPCTAGQQGQMDGGQRFSARGCLSWYYPYNPVGAREWVQVDNDTWDEYYPPDKRIRDQFRVFAHATMYGVHGNIAYKVSSSIFQVFIPDEDTPKPFFILMHWTILPNGWTKLGEVN